MSRHIWKRPEMPEDGTAVGIGLGWFLIVGGGLSAFLSTTDQGPGAIGMVISQAVCSLGVFMIALGLILREIRRVAFEAAVRAGETTIKGKKTG
ncbi:hypothetical protein [Hyphomonas oceanitis]|uniref:hypothetical protein n=1 Tax=Hyphomonas oceanitis TaxID=81033 RepID=UPI0030023A3D